MYAESPKISQFWIVRIASNNLRSTDSVRLECVLLIHESHSYTDADAVKDYFDGADLIGARNLGAAGFGRNSNLPPGVNFEDFVQANGSFDITAFREALREALEAQDTAQAAAIQQGTFI